MKIMDSHFLLYRHHGHENSSQIIKMRLEEAQELQLQHQQQHISDQNNDISNQKKYLPAPDGRTLAWMRQVKQNEMDIGCRPPC